MLDAKTITKNDQKIDKNRDACEAESAIFREHNPDVKTVADDAADQLPRWSSVLLILLTAVEFDDNLWVVIGADERVFLRETRVATLTTA